MTSSVPTTFPWIHGLAPAYVTRQAYQDALHSQLTVTEEDIEASKHVPVYHTPQAPFGSITGYQLSASIESGRPRPDYWFLEERRRFESFRLTAYVRAQGDTPECWVIHWLDMHPVNSDFWPRVPSLAHACAWVRSYPEVHAGECSRLPLTPA